MISRSGRIAADDLEAVAELLTDVLDERGTWCNLVFEPLEDDEGPEDSALFSFLAARGPSNPFATIMAGDDGKRSSSAQVGIQHRAGTKAAAQLREEALFLPEGARVRQDHPRRGLVVEWPTDSNVATLVGWLLPAMRLLGRAPTTNSILYEWHHA